MKNVLSCASEAAMYISEKINIKPRIAIILGSGLGELADEVIDERVEIPYEEIPHFHVPTVSGHKGKIIAGKIYDKDVIIMQGRLHYYEGYELADVAYSLRLREIAKRAIDYSEDDINLRDKLFGARNDFNSKIELKEGVYAYMTGPQYETPAEVKMLEILGADAVGMSTVPEVIVANHMGMEVLGISCITNATGAGIVQSHEEVIENADKAANNLKRLVMRIIRIM